MKLDPRTWSAQELTDYRRASCHAGENITADAREGGTVITYEMRGTLYGAAWTGRAARPAWHYSFRTPEQRNAEIARFWQGVESTAKYRAERQAQRKADRCTNPAQVYAKAIKAGGDNYLTAADVAVCLRASLARHWPAAKFSVTSGNGLNVSWTDGPSYEEVNTLARRYAFEGFDGMIDLRYSITRWLSPDGEMALAHSTGTEGSMGSDPEAIGSPHSPQAVEVKATSDFVFCHREISYPVKRRLAERVCAMFGQFLPELPDASSLERFINTTRIPNACCGGEYLSTLVHQASTGALELPPVASISDAAILNPEDLQG